MFPITLIHNVIGSKMNKVSLHISFLSLQVEDLQPTGSLHHRSECISPHHRVSTLTISLPICTEVCYSSIIDHFFPMASHYLCPHVDSATFFNGPPQQQGLGLFAR